MADKRGAPGLGVPVITIDSVDIIRQILLCLPAADVHRCRFVCKLWRGLVSGDATFISTYRQRHPPMPLFFYRRDFNLGTVVPGQDPGVARVDLQAVDLAARESRLLLRFPDVPDPAPAFHDLNLQVGLNELDVNFVMPDSVFWVEGSCDGVLLLHHGGRVYLCNPCTRHWALLPPPAIDRAEPHRIVAFYPRERQEFEILYQAGRHDTGHMDDLSYWIRRIRHEQDDTFEIGAPPANPPALDVPFTVSLGPAHHLPPAMVAGSLYWSFLFEGDTYILVFDTAQYEFRWISPPEDDDGGDQFIPWFLADGGDAGKVVETGGSVAMRVFNEERTAVDVWVLPDPAAADGDGDRAWARRCSIQLPTEEMQANNAAQLGQPIVYVVSQEPPQVLVRCPYVMLQSAADGSVRQRYQRAHHWTIGTRFMLEETFVPHRLLSAQGNDDEQPFFLFQ